MSIAAVNRRLNTPELNHIREATTQACLEQRRELDRALSRQARQSEKGEGWEPEPTREEDAWEE